MNKFMQTKSAFGVGSSFQALALALCCHVLPTAAVAQTAPERREIDENGFDLLAARTFIDATDISIGSGPAEIAFRRTGTGTGFDNYDISIIHDYPYSVDYLVQFADRTIRFHQVTTTTYEDTSGAGYTLSTSPQMEIVDPNGVRYVFGFESGRDFEQSDGIWRATKIIQPNGSTVFIHWTTHEVVNVSDEGWYYQYFDRIQSVRNNFGYQLKFFYQDDSCPNDNCGAYTVLSKITALNNAVEYCNPDANQCTFSNSWPAVNYAYPDGSTVTVTTPSGQVKSYNELNISGDADEASVQTINGVGQYTVTRKGRSIAYAYVGATIKATDALGNWKLYTLGTSGNGSGRIVSMADELNRVTSYLYDAKGRVTRVTRPEGNYVEYTYDARGNVTQEKRVAKSDSGLSDIIASSSFPSTCTNPVTCNKPTSTTDPRGKVTDYTYDSTHGGMLTMTAPAATTGAIRPQTRFSYASKQGYYKNSAGSIVASGFPIYMPTSTSTCQTTASCSGGSDEVKTTIDYGPQSSGTANNLLPVSVSSGSGDGVLTATSTFGYDNIGNQLTVDGPLSGSADTTRTRYDADRRVVGMVGPDPDGAGSRVPVAQKVTYNSLGQVSLMETGAVADQSDGAWASFSTQQQSATTFDSYTRPVKQELKSGGTTYALTQTKYDTLSRVSCTAQRMDPSVWASQTDACVAQTTGSYGPDRIAKTNYDAASEVTSVQTAYGTTDQATEVTSTFNSNGTLATVKDGENNLTTYEYDGHDRLTKTRYPSTTQGAGTSSTTDYEQPTYDANGNVTSMRQRDGQTVGFTFDNLNRNTFIDVSGSGTDQDMTFAYDLLGRMTASSNPLGFISNFGYDALNRKVSETPTYSSGKTFQYDLAGRRTRMTWPDGLYIAYDYDVTGNVTAIRENGATSGAGVLATYTYDNLGRRTGVTRGNGTTSSYGFDAVSRLTSLSHDLSGSSNDITIGSMAYNPASQILSQVRSNDAYAWGGHYNVNRNYTVNGLNQATAAGAVSLGYDGRGNLTSSGTNTYSYTQRNLLQTYAAGNIYYDPMGRLSLNLITANGTGPTFDYDGASIVGEGDWYTGTTLRRYVYGPGTDEPIVWYEGSGTTDRRWLHADERGSVIAVSDGSGAAIAVNKYDEFGIPAATNIGRFQYTGQAWIPEIGMYYYKARMYSATLGRFMQADPIGYNDGMNMYAYVTSDPVNATDPSGLSCADVGQYSNAYCDPWHPNDDAPEINVGRTPFINFELGDMLSTTDWRGLLDGQTRDRERFASQKRSGASRRATRQTRSQCSLGKKASGFADAMNYTGIAHSFFEEMAKQAGAMKFGPAGPIAQVMGAGATAGASILRGEPANIVFARTAYPMAGGLGGSAVGSIMGSRYGQRFGTPGRVFFGAGGAVAGSIAGDALGGAIAEQQARKQGYGGC